MRIAHLDERTCDRCHIDGLHECREARTNGAAFACECESESRFRNATDALEWRVLGKSEQLSKVPRVARTFAEVVAKRCVDNGRG